MGESCSAFNQLTSLDSDVLTERQLTEQLATQEALEAVQKAERQQQEEESDSNEEVFQLLKRAISLQ